MVKQRYRLDMLAGPGGRMKVGNPIAYEVLGVIDDYLSPYMITGDVEYYRPPMAQYSIQLLERAIAQSREIFEKHHYTSDAVALSIWPGNAPALITNDNEKMAVGIAPINPEYLKDPRGMFKNRMYWARWIE